MAEKARTEKGREEGEAAAVVKRADGGRRASEGESGAGRALRPGRNFGLRKSSVNKRRRTRAHALDRGFPCACACLTLLGKACHGH